MPRAAHRPIRACGGLRPTRLATAPSRRRWSSTSATGCRASSRRCAAIARRWDPTIRCRGSTTTKRGRGSAPSSSPAPRSRETGTGSSRISATPRSSMRTDTLDLLRCPYCGGRLSLVDALFHEAAGETIRDGVLGCHCCLFPVVDGIPVMHLLPASVRALDQIKAGRADLARRTIFRLDDEAQAATFDAVASSPTATYRETVEAFGPNFEGGYFLYRFSDPTYLVAQALVRAIGSTVLTGAARAVDICGGSGHVTRALLDLSSAPPILADLYFAKIWLARQFTAPGCEPVCCDGNAPMPFARGAFAFAMCTDAFMYIWTKRQFVGEMERLIDAQRDRSRDRDPRDGAVLIGHTHN